jgi:hypothetical protein
MSWRQYAVRICHLGQGGRLLWWPWYYIGSNEDPRHKDARPDLKGKVTVPDVLMEAHSAHFRSSLIKVTTFRLSAREALL